MLLTFWAREGLVRFKFSELSEADGVVGERVLAET